MHTNVIELKTKMFEQAKLLSELSGSTQLEELWPGVFEHGRCKTTFVGKWENPAELEFVIMSGNGERRDYELKDVPFGLITDLVRRQTGYPEAYLNKVILGIAEYLRHKG
jgi:hypothetical protein